MKKPRQFRIDQELLDRFDRVNKTLAVNGSEVVRRLMEEYTAEKERELVVPVDEIIELKDDFPNDGEAYTVGKANGKYFFTWGSEFPYADEVPSFDIPEGDSGISWHKTKKQALAAMNEAVEAWDAGGIEMRLQFVVDAKKFFEVDADRLAKVKEGDLVLVTIDFEEKKADYIWYGEGENPANHPAIEDDFDAVVKLWEELGKPGKEE